MPIDTSIPLSIKPPQIVDPFQLRAETQQRAQQTRLNDLRIADADAAHKKAQLDQQENEQIRQLLANGLTEDVVPKIAAINPAKAKVFLDLKAATRKEDLDADKEKTDFLLRKIPMITSDAGIQRFKQDAGQLGFDVSDVPDVFDNKWKQEALKQAAMAKLNGESLYKLLFGGDPASEPLERVMKDGKPVLVKRSEAAGMEPFTQSPTPAADPLEEVIQNGRPVLLPRSKAAGMTPYHPSSEGGREAHRWILRDGEELFVPESQIRPGDKPMPSTSAKETTEDERKTAGFYRQMKQAISILDSVESSLSPKELYQIQTLPQEGLIGMANRNELSENAKRYLRAFEQFTEARLRPVSGAAINDGEYARDRRTYAKQYGETPKLAEDRKAARNLALNSLQQRAGRAFTDDEKPTETTSSGGDWIDAGNGLRVRRKQ